MDRCKDCVHFGICKKGFPFADGKGGGWCEDFIRKADYVKVVRCKDCKHSEPCGESRQCLHPFGLNTLDGNDFCSYGERREGE